MSKTLARWCTHELYDFSLRLSATLVAPSGRSLRCAFHPAFAANEAGKYQTVLGDCEGCHGKNLAGGVALTTPFGKLVTPNITPDRDTGIGNYSRPRISARP